MTVHPYRQAFEARDLAGAKSLLADNVVFHSPVIGEPGFEGRETVGALLEVVFDAVTDVAYTHEFGDQGPRIFVFDGRVLGKPIKGVNLIEFDSEGKIREIWVLARPLIGVTAIAEAIGSGLARHQGAANGAAVRAASKPLSGMAALAERIGGRIIARLNRQFASGS